MQRPRIEEWHRSAAAIAGSMALRMSRGSVSIVEMVRWEQGLFNISLEIKKYLTEEKAKREREEKRHEG